MSGVGSRREITGDAIQLQVHGQAGRKVKLADYAADDTPGYKHKEAAKQDVAGDVARLADLQQLLYAENKRSLLVILQGMDAGGKDGTIRHVMSGVNPQGCRVTSFKVPSAEEASHDFLWRIHKALPGRGEIGVFNRSHYEDVLVVRVHGLAPKEVWSERYDQINAFEAEAVQNGAVLLKFFLHISKDEQKKRLQERLEDPKKNWKFSPADMEERKYWDDYVEAYQTALSRCSTSWAPWSIIPANKKWFRNLAVSQIIVEALEEMDMKFPKPAFDLSRSVSKSTFSTLLETAGTPAWFRGDVGR